MQDPLPEDKWCLWNDTMLQVARSYYERKPIKQVDDKVKELDDEMKRLRMKRAKFPELREFVPSSEAVTICQQENENEIRIKGWMIALRRMAAKRRRTKCAG